jgi:hypothetical protein
MMSEFASIRNLLVAYQPHVPLEGSRHIDSGRSLRARSPTETAYFFL